MTTLTDAEWVARLSARPTPTATILGTQVLAVDQAQGTVRLGFLARPEFCNPMGTVQGGFVAAMLDDAAAIAAIIRGEGRIAIPTLEFKVSFLGAAYPGPLFATGRCLKLAKSAAFLAADLHDGAGQLLASLTATALPRAFPATPKTTDPAA